MSSVLIVAEGSRDRGRTTDGGAWIATRITNGPKNLKGREVIVKLTKAELEELLRDF